MDKSHESIAAANGITQQRQHVELTNTLQKWGDSFGVTLESLEFAKRMDAVDPLRDIRDNFTFPTMKDLPCVDQSLVENLDEECIYLCGNSLGLKPKRADAYQQDVLNCWGKLGVFTHFTGRFPAAQCDLLVKESLVKLVGAGHSDEVVCMNGLSVNIHLLLISFYRPTANRYKIMIEGHSFPSDRYAVVSQLKLHGYTEEDGLVILQTRTGEHLLRTEDILAAIQEHGQSVAVVFLSGVHYYTGQKFDIETITKSGQAQGCLVGWDLAHAAGNTELKLHDWSVDFACWCSYKYLNSGAGCIAGAFIHRKHHQDDRPRLCGWWSNREETRFDMQHSVDAAPGADAYRLCNPPPALVALHKAGLEIFEEAGMDRLLAKQYLLTGYLEYLMDHLDPDAGETGDEKFVEIITPRDPRQRGTQLSVMFPFSVKEIHEKLEKRGVVCDVRLPSVMRLAPTASYNTFTDVYRFFTVLKQVMMECRM
ncbi:hypothetical protein DAPPUDRAFT_310889 [Daphnia pulex]|uniref:Kynureninase n=1 Tax=Daphnia pulex TaxID=6669 RepID=E9FVX1_DAPPU|nr:hypothetical protein DAPPUDRAFT_310889 [Daphnia pulex]|eukprot:EFX89028.1 hypothetical protein DAPPUDRAFT_310889 [Daphnia pulex]